MTDYSKTVIYKITCNDPTVIDIYVGHTVKFTNRKQNHKYYCNNNKSPHHNLLIYQTIRENGGWDNWTMVEVEKFPCENKTKAIVRERYWYKQLNGTMNSNVPSRTLKEYRQDNKDKIAEYNTQYYQDNKEQLIEKSKEKIECDCGGCYTNCHKSRHLKSKKHQLFISQSVV